MPPSASQMLSERNELLRYVLQHPPTNVTIKFPDGFTSLDKIDLTLCPSPLDLYKQAEKSAISGSPKGSRPQIFVFDMKESLTFIGGSSGGVQRAGGSPGTARAKKSKSPRDTFGRHDSKPNSSSPAQSQRQSAEATGAAASSSPHRNTEPSTSASPSADKSNKSDAQQQQRLMASEQSSPRPPNAHTSGVSSGNSANANANANANASATAAAAAPPPEPSKGFFGSIVNTIRGLGAAAPDNNNGSSNNNNNSSAGNQKAAPASNSKAHPGRVGSGNSTASGILSAMWNPLASIQGTRSSSPANISTGRGDEEQETLDVARRMEQLQIPLCGSTSGTMSHNITTQFGPFFDAMEEKRRASGAMAAAARGFPCPPNIQLCEVLNSAPLAPFLDILPIFAYESLLRCAGLLQTKKHEVYEREIREVYGRVFNISDEQHRRSLDSLTPPSLKTALNESDATGLAERRRYISDLRVDPVSLQLLCDNSTDDEFLNRTEQLLQIIENYPDSPGDTRMPFAIRAMVYATCLLPLYQLDLSTLNPIYTEEDVENCLDLLRARLGISPEIERYCHLHSQLLANDQCGSVEAQTVFLKDVARAVSSLGARSIANDPLSPPVKYAYYVLQETFCLAAVPMPWLDSTFSYDMQRGVSAVFIETCLALPTCMLSAMLLVEDMPVLPPSASGEAFLLTFIEVFVNSGVFRNYAERMDNRVDVHAYSAATLLQRVSTGLDTQQRSYCKMLTRSFPLATLLIVPGRLRIGAYTLLMRHWGGAYPSPHGEVPKDYLASMEAFLQYLLDGCNGEKRTSQSESLCSLMIRSTQTYLAPFTSLAEAEEVSFYRSAKQQVANMNPPWAVALDQSTELPVEVLRILRAVYASPRPPPLAGDPAAQHQARLLNWVGVAKALVERCMEGFPSLASSPDSAKIPYIAVQYERFCNAVTGLKTFSAPLIPGAIHRLHTLVQVRDSYVECLVRAHRQYDLVRRVTGAGAVSFEELQDICSHTVYESLLRVCDTISVEVLTSDVVKDALSKFMRLDAKKYEAMKQAHGKNDDFPMPRAYPEVTMRSILDQLHAVAESVCAHLSYEPAVRQVYYRIGHNFVALLFSVYVDGAGVFLSTADAPLILDDLDLVRSYFFEVRQEAASHPPNAAAGAANTYNGNSPACQAVATVLRTSGTELLEKLYRIVQYVMSRPSAELDAGGVGVPPLHTLPETSDDSPWCQYVVRSVLEHRKDFKRIMWLPYSSRQRTKSTYS